MLPVVGATFPAQSGTVVIDPLTSTYATDLTVQYAAATGSALVPVTTPGVDRADFLATGHSLFALLGGAITRRCSSRALKVALFAAAPTP
jgi:hypothetical protein